MTHKNYNEALKIVNNDDFFSEERSELLNKLEKGTTYYLKNDYFQAMQYFKEAREISDNLYTISIKKKLASILNANLDNYYGEIYERSLLRFYESLIHYNLYQTGKYEAYTKTIEGKTIVAYKGIVFGEVIQGINFVKEV